MGAWMKSNNTGKFYLTGEFTVRENIPQAEASQISDVLGFDAARAEGKAINAEIARVTENRARLVKEIADKVLAGVASGVTVTADVDSTAIAGAVEKRLADEFQSLPGAVADEQAKRLTD